MYTPFINSRKQAKISIVYELVLRSPVLEDTRIGKVYEYMYFIFIADYVYFTNSLLDSKA